MKSASTTLINFFNSAQQILMADLFTITLLGGYVVRYTNADIDIYYNGNIFKKFIITRSRTKVSVGVEVDTLDVDVMASPTDLLNGASWLNAAQRGALDGATLRLERVFMQNWGDTSMGGVLLFLGRVSDVQVSRTQARLQAKTEMELLNTKLPRNLYQSPCLNTLFDNACARKKTEYGIAGIVTSSTLINITGTNVKSDDYFSLGTIRFETGVNAGVVRSVRMYRDGVFTLQIPLVSLCLAGDTFTAHPGCDKLKDTCDKKFNNKSNFRGFPYIPTPETVL